MKKTLMLILLFLVCGIGVLAMTGCRESRRQSQERKVPQQRISSKKSNSSQGIRYLRYNFHYYARGRDSYKVASVVNYVNCPNHGFLPFNTEVSVGSYKRGFKLTVAKTGETILVEAPSKYLGHNSKEDYLDLILSSAPVSYTDLSEIDQKGVSSGIPIEGMSRKGVMIALGYPVPSFNPDHDSNVWHYWNSRFIKCDVQFKDGEVEYIRGIGR